MDVSARQGVYCTRRLLYAGHVTWLRWACHTWICAGCTLNRGPLWLTVLILARVEVQLVVVHIIAADCMAVAAESGWQ
jgi:hypothetical protein